MVFFMFLYPNGDTWKKIIFKLKDISHGFEI